MGQCELLYRDEEGKLRKISFGQASAVESLMDVFYKGGSSPIARGEHKIVKELEAMGSDYETNFYLLIKDKVREDKDFSLGEYLLSYLGRTRKVSLETLTKLNLYYYNNYDSNEELDPLEYDTTYKELKEEFYTAR